MSNKKTIQILRKELAKKNKQLEAERALWESDSTARRLNKTIEPSMSHRLEVLDDIICTPKYLYGSAGITPEGFEWLLEMFVEEIEQTDEAPQFRDGGMPDENEPGNRCKLYIRHALLLTLMRLRSKPTEDQLAAQFGVDQGTVSRYLKLCKSVLTVILPTAQSLSDQLKKWKSKDQRKLLPGGNGGNIIIDGTRIPCKRPEYPEGKRMYSGKIKRHSMNTLVGINNHDVVVWISKTHPGSVHDSSIVSEIADVIPCMIQKSLPAEKRIRCVMDRGFVGTKKKLPGITEIVSKKRTKFNDLSDSDRARNKRINRERIGVEHAIGRMKNYSILTEPYVGTQRELNQDLNIVTGLVNLRILFKQIKNKRGPYGRIMEKLRQSRLRR